MFKINILNNNSFNINMLHIVSENINRNHQNENRDTEWFRKLNAVKMKLNWNFLFSFWWNYELLRLLFNKNLLNDNFSLRNLISKWNSEYRDFSLKNIYSNSFLSKQKNITKFYRRNRKEVLIWFMFNMMFYLN
jgi:hypothetical protein